MQEAGGAVGGLHEAFASWSSSSSFGDVTEEILGRNILLSELSGIPM